VLATLAITLMIILLVDFGLIFAVLNWSEIIAMAVKPELEDLPGGMTLIFRLIVAMWR